MNREKEIQNIIDKYLPEGLRRMSESILNDRKYLLDHQDRTCKHSFDITLNFQLQYMVMEGLKTYSQKP